MTEGYNPFPGFLSVPTTCVLQNTATDGLEQGCLAYVTSTATYYKLVYDAALPVDGTRVLSTYNGPPAVDAAGDPCPQTANNAHSLTGPGRWVSASIGAASVTWKLGAPFSEVYAQIQAAEGPLVVWLQEAGTYSIPAGIYDLNFVTFRAPIGNPASVVLNLEDGAYVSRLGLVDGSMTLVGNTLAPNTSPILPYQLGGPGDPYAFFIGTGALVKNLGSVPMMTIPPSAFLVYASLISDGVDPATVAPIVSLGAGAAALLALIEIFSYGPNFVAGDGTNLVAVQNSSGIEEPPAGTIVGGPTVLNLPPTGVTTGGAGSTAFRPGAFFGGPTIGCSYYDRDIGMPIWYAGAGVWKDAAGNPQ